MTEDGATVLVVDDVEANIRLLEALLQSDGHVVVSASSGPEALDAVNGSVDLVVLDINMPGMNGLEVCRRIREEDNGRVLPILMVTSDADENTVTAVEAGADDFVNRPFDQDELLARVRSLVRIKQLHDVVQHQAEELASLNESLQARVEEQMAELEALRRLRRFLSPQLAEVVLSAGNEDLLEPHRRQVAVVFCDLRGYTRFAAGAEPEELVEALGRFHAVLGELVAEHEATVGHFDGDGVMLFFNDPIPCPAPALRAVRFSIAVRDAVVPLHDEWRRRGHDLDIGFGVSFGFATLGTIGFEGRYDYTALGPVVNRAARVCTAALPGEVLVDQRVFGDVRDEVQAEEREPIDAKGFPEPVDVWAVTAISAAAEEHRGHRTEINLLGPLELWVDGEIVDLSGKEAALLGLLAASANRTVDSAVLVEDLWEGSPPSSASTSLRVYVSRLRKALSAAGADALIHTKAPGYRLEVEDVAVDVNRFERAVEAAREALDADDPRAAAARFGDALSVWRGPAMPEVAASPHIAAEVARLDEMRLVSLEDRIDAELAAGEHDQLVAELRGLVKVEPLRERLWGQLMLALYRAGRQAEALRAYQSLREVLGTELGLEPSVELARLEQAIVEQSEVLDLRSGLRGLSAPLLET